MNELEDDFFQLLYQNVETLSSHEVTDEIHENDDDSYAIPTQFLYIAPAGGAISERDKDYNALPFRDAKYLFVMCGRWINGYTDATNYIKTWLDATMDDIQPYLSQYSFVKFFLPMLN